MANLFNIFATYIGAYVPSFDCFLRFTIFAAKLECLVTQKNKHLQSNGQA